MTRSRRAALLALLAVSLTACARSPPIKGATVTARGVVHQAFAIGDQSLTVIIEAAQ